VGGECVTEFAGEEGVGLRGEGGALDASGYGLVHARRRGAEEWEQAAFGVREKSTSSRC
jgi:hypothetical protein